jgi:acyl-CoA synthetase (AMP-forming)/AMP-acid ligase II
VPLPAATANIARYLDETAARQPNGIALKVPRGRTRRGEIDYLTLSFQELAAEVDAWSERLGAAGVRPRDRALVMVKPGLPLIASVFALFKLGAVPVVIDPGMGLKSFLQCVAQSRPRALVGIPLALILSRLFVAAFASVSIRVVTRGSLDGRLTEPGAQPSGREAYSTDAVDLAAILFTSGSTGNPKGVCYEHGMFEAQVRLIRETYGIEAGEIDLPMLPIFALFNPALGVTTIVPEMDPRRPAAVDPAKIVQAILQEGVTTSFGSPTLWKKIGDHCIQNNITLPTLRRVLCAGAAVPESLWKNSRTWMPNGLLHSPYGATEALPVASISSSGIEAVRGAGACVGRPLKNIAVRIIAIDDSAIGDLDAAVAEVPGVIGEIIVSGPVVTTAYDHAPAATTLAKIPSKGRATWHRMGDCGYLDTTGRLWFCGRKVERVVTANGTLFTEPCERVFRTHHAVGRCALIGIGDRGQQRAALVVETSQRGSRALRLFADELRTLALSQPVTAPISLFYFHRRFPVDVRHNAKIHRLALAHWAQSKPGFETADSGPQGAASLRPYKSE